MSDRSPSTSGAESAPAVPEATGEAEQRGSLLGFVAHEVRNPLSTALWSAELLARLSPEERAGARGQKLAGMCLRSLQRLRLLVEDHFLAERLEAGGMPMRREEVPLREALEAARTRAGPAAVDVAVAEDVTAWADRGLVERALEGILAVVGRDGAVASVVAARGPDGVALTFRGAPLAADALQPPRKGTASDPSGRALSLHVAARAAQVLGGSLAAAGGGLVLLLPTPPDAA